MAELFRTLSCPNCGGHLQVNKRQKSFVCDYCKTEHLINLTKNSLEIEDIARCPVCKLHDRTTRISAILRNSSPLAEKFRFPFSPPPRPADPKYPVFPKNQEPYNETSTFIIISLVIFAIAFAFCIPVVSYFKIKSFWSILMILIVITAFSNLIYSIVKNERFKKQENERRVAFFQGKIQEHIQQRNSINQEHNKVLAKYQKKVEQYLQEKQRWEQSYYCERDDVVFVPGQSKTATPENMSILFN